MAILLLFAFPFIIADIIASYGYYDFWQWLFCKTNQRFLDALCLALFTTTRTTKLTMTTTTKRKQLPPNHTIPYTPVSKLIFSLLLNEATLTEVVVARWRWFVAKTTGSPFQLCIHYHYIITTIIINFETDGLCGCAVAIDCTF